jgi:hypothetical protein
MRDDVPPYDCGECTVVGWIESGLRPPSYTSLGHASRECQRRYVRKIRLVICQNLTAFSYSSEVVYSISLFERLRGVAHAGDARPA